MEPNGIVAAGSTEQHLLKTLSLLRASFVLIDHAAFDSAVHCICVAMRHAAQAVLELLNSAPETYPPSDREFFAALSRFDAEENHPLYGTTVRIIAAEVYEPKAVFAVDKPCGSEELRGVAIYVGFALSSIVTHFRAEGISLDCIEALDGAISTLRSHDHE